MVDAEDLKSFGHCDRVGSSPTIPTTIRQNMAFFVGIFGCVAQLVRALRSHRRGRWFESNHIHHNLIPIMRWGLFLLLIADPWRDSTRMPQFSSRNIVWQVDVNRAMVANHCSACSNRCQCTLHSDAGCMSGLKSCQYLWCILQQYFGFLHRLAQFVWMTEFDMRVQKIWCRKQSLMRLLSFSYFSFLGCCIFLL